MEDTLRVLIENGIDYIKIVLILVLMEDTLRGKRYFSKLAKRNSLNPCFNGRYS